jgi:hypothetical protein
VTRSLNADRDERNLFFAPQQLSVPQRNSLADSAIWRELAEIHHGYYGALNAMLSAAGNRRALEHHLLTCIYNAALATREAAQQATATAWGAS